MGRYLLRRLLAAIPVVWLASTIVFALVHLVPGDPAELLLGDGAQPADVVALRRDLGLDRPLTVQYASFLGGLLRGDLGTSLHSGEPVAAVLGARFPATLQLAFAAMTVALVIAVPLGAAAALRPGRLADHVARGFALVTVSVPSFWLGPMLILAFAIALDLLPVSGRGGIASVVLPAMTLGAALAGLLTRMIQTALAGELSRPYLIAARARGASTWRVLAVHAARNAALPVVTVLGLQFGSLLTGSILTETIFSWPGVGRLLVEAIRLRDYPLVEGAVLLIAVTYVLVNVATDLVYAWIDPRIRLSR